MPNELKPEDVMRALECCNTKGNCNQCPYEIVGEYTPCYSALTQDALALLREKDAEIERLRKQLNDQLWDMPPMGGFHDD